MKLCPHCEFIYEDDQSFCDMDGKELVYNPGQLAFEENAPSTSAQLQHSAATPVVLTPGPAPIPTPGLPSSVPSSWQSRSYAVAAVAGVLLATLLFVVYYARTHRSRSDNANQSHDQSYDRSTSRAPDTQSSTSDLVSPSAPLAENASTQQSTAQSPTQSTGQLASPYLTPPAQFPPSLSPASEKSLTRAHQAPGPVSAAASSATNRAPVVIQLTNGASIKADEAWEGRDGIWYRQGGMVTFLKRSRVKAIQRLATPHRSQQPAGKPEASIARNQRRVGKSEVTAPKKESKVSSFLKKTGRILRKPFKF